MAYPIRFKLIDKRTGETIKGDRCPLLLPDGTPAIMRQDFYTFVDKASCADYELHVALERDHEGRWLYRKIGH